MTTKVRSLATGDPGYMIIQVRPNPAGKGVGVHIQVLTHKTNHPDIAQELRRDYGYALDIPNFELYNLLTVLLKD